MGQIIFHCTHCGAKLAAELDEAGADFDCPECKHTQIVPGGAAAQAAATATSPGTIITPRAPSAAMDGMPVVRIPKRKIVIPSSETQAARQQEEDDFVEVEDVGGTGVGLFAVALGTSGLLLCAISMIWMLLQQRSGSENWWMSLIVFLSTFLMGLMGLVLAQLARLVVRLADRVSTLSVDEE